MRKQEEELSKMECHTKPAELSVGKNMLWNSVGSVTYLAFQWAISIIIVRMSNGQYDAAGLLSLSMSIYGIFAPIALYRLNAYQVSDIHHENSTGEYLALRLITSNIALASCMVYSVITCSPESLLAIFLFAIFKICGILIDVLHGVDQLNARMDYIGKSLILQGVSFFAAFIVIFGFTQNLELAFLGMTATTVLVGIFYDLPRSSRFERIKIRISKKKAAHLLIRCFPVVIAAMAASAAPNVPRQLLASLDGESALGIYASVAAPVAIIQMGASYIYSPLLTVITRRFEEDSNARFAGLMLKITVAIAAIGVVCALLLEVFGPWILTLLYGPTIAPYTYLLLPVIINAVFTAYLWFLNDTLLVIRCFKGNVIGSVVAVAVAFATMFPFISLWNMNGVSFTGIASTAAAVIAMLILLLRHCRKTNRKRHTSETPFEDLSENSSTSGA